MGIKTKIKKMIRTKRNTNTPDAILTGDWHLREDQPTCRTDDFWETQWEKVKFISDLQKQYNCPVIHSGDLFNHWKPSPWLISKTIECLPNEFFTIFGNHDLPQHNLELAHKTGIYAISKAKRLSILAGTHWGLVPDKSTALIIKNRKILVWHVMSYIGKAPWPGCTDPKAHVLLNKYEKDYDLILTGHNHKPFVTKLDNTLLVNPGSLSRQAADQMDFKPRVYLYYANTNTVTPVYIPIKADVVSNEHLKLQKERDNRIDAFISQLDVDWEGKIGFEQNLETFFQKNKIKPEVKQLIYNTL